MSELPDIHDALFRLGNELALDPDDWIDQLVKSGALVEVTIDYEAAAKAIYKVYEDCSDKYVEQVWAWESIPEDTRANREAREAFQMTVQEFTMSAQLAFAAAIGDTPSTVTSADWFNIDDNI